MSRPQAEPADVRSAGRDDDLHEVADAGLVEAFLAGRREAFDVIVARHQRQVYQLCYRFARHHEDAADLAQDVFVRAYKGLSRFKGQAALGTWLHRIAVNACLNRVAVKRPVFAPLDETQHVDDGAPDPLRALVTSERASRLREAVDRLPPKQRATLILRIYEDCSHEEIARLLGGSVGAAKANLFHALANLRRSVTS